MKKELIYTKERTTEIESRKNYGRKHKANIQRRDK